MLLSGLGFRVVKGMQHAACIHAATQEVYMLLRGLGFRVGPA